MILTGPFIQTLFCAALGFSSTYLIAPTEQHISSSMREGRVADVKPSVQITYRSAGFRRRPAYTIGS